MPSASCADGTRVACLLDGCMKKPPPQNIFLVPFIGQQALLFWYYSFGALLEQVLLLCPLVQPVTPNPAVKSQCEEGTEVNL